MAFPLKVQHITITINRSFTDVSEYLSHPVNFEQWAAGLRKGFRQVNGEWIFEAGDSIAKIHFTDRNPFGVADHWVYPQPDVEIYVPMRVVPNEDGSEVIFTLFRRPEMTDQQLEGDRAAVQRDLETLKAILKG